MAAVDYISNETLHHEIVLSQRNKRPTDALGAMLMMMAERISRMKRFSGYGYRDDLVSHAVLHGLQNYQKYTPANGAAFAWATSLLSNVMIDYIRKENRQDAIAFKYWQRIIPDHLPDIMEQDTD